ncbi:MAG: PDZ domain-containing protein [Verrucomicrobiaceae bacterium]|nr:PDZ domain-containing protein [Verrucomicrobiaceae bacterium]
MINVKQLLSFPQLLGLLTIASTCPSFAQGSPDELPENLRLNGSKTVLAFGPGGEAARLSTLVIQQEGEIVALATAIDPDGHLLTKSSELDAKGKISAFSPSGEKLEAAILARDPANDLALLKVPSGKVIPIEWGNPDNLSQGSWVAAMTYDADSLMIGVISATRREIERRPGVLGVTLDPNDDPDELGVAIDGFGPNSPAQKQGMQSGDLIIRVQSTDIKSRRELADQISKFDPMDEVEIKILRGEEGIAFTVTLNYKSNVFDMLDRNQQMSGKTSRRKAGFSDVLQHELPLTPQAMGGPLVNLQGKAMGINIARADRVTTFALPASVAIKIAEELKKQR